MYKFVIYSITGFRGISNYDTHAQALEAARFRTDCTGIPWFVSAIYIPERVGQPTLLLC